MNNSRNKIIESIVALFLFNFISNITCEHNGQFYTKMAKHKIVGPSIMDTRVSTDFACAARCQKETKCIFFGINFPQPDRRVCTLYRDYSTIITDDDYDSYVITPEEYLLHYHYTHHDGRWYLHRTNHMTYAEAITMCQAKKAEIFLPKTLKDMDYVNFFRDKWGINRIWFPISDQANETTFLWQDGTAVTAEQEANIPWLLTTTYYGNDPVNDCGQMNLDGEVHLSPCTDNDAGAVCSLIELIY